MQILMVEGVFLILLIVITLSIILNRDLLATVVMFCAFSFCASLLYLIMGAPDVAFTEAVIGVVSTVFFVILLRSVDRWCKK